MMLIALLLLLLLMPLETTVIAGVSSSPSYDYRKYTPQNPSNYRSYDTSRRQK